MNSVSWPAAAVAIALIVTIAAMFITSTDPDAQRQLLGYMGTVVGFVAGLFSGAAVAGSAVYLAMKPK
jgi:uncharacterized membrane protein YfcA